MSVNLLRIELLTYILYFQVKGPVRVILLHCDSLFAKDRFIGRRRNTTDDKELFDKRFKEYDEKLLAIHDHYRGIVTNVSVNR